MEYPVVVRKPLTKTEIMFLYLGGLILHRELIEWSAEVEV